MRLCGRHWGPSTHLGTPWADEMLTRVKEEKKQAEWILTAKTAGEIAVSGSLQEKRVLAQKVFGSNLVLDGKKARGSCVKPWSLLVETSISGGMVRAAGFEPATPTV